ncbi:MAG: tryptophan 2,3-dioxygenase [Actinomycetota bacterium]
MALTYGSYLKVPELLDLNRPLTDEHDEVLFITIHQVYELWFFQMMHELREVQRRLEAGEGGRALATLKRVLTILKLNVAQLDVLETMSPTEFASFRARLESASGFQSAQFREFEAMFGRRDRSAMSHHPKGPARTRIEEAMARPDLYDSLCTFLAARGAAVPADVLGRDVTKERQADPRMQEVLLRVYREDPDAAGICERFVDLDEGVQEWRYRHVKMVERTIGSKPGTGGSSGADYLQGTLFHPAFPDLWAIRALL